MVTPCDSKWFPICWGFLTHTDGQRWPRCTPCSISLGKRPAWLRHLGGIQPGSGPLWSPVHPFKSFNLGRNSVDWNVDWKQLKYVEVQQTNQRTKQPADSARGLLKGAVALSPRSAGRPGESCHPIRFLGSSLYFEPFHTQWWSKWEGLNINKHHEKCIYIYIIVDICRNVSNMSEHIWTISASQPPFPCSSQRCELWTPTRTCCKAGCCRSASQTCLNAWPMARWWIIWRLHQAKSGGMINQQGKAAKKNCICFYSNFM